MPWYVIKYYNGHYNSQIGPMDHNAAIAKEAELRRAYAGVGWTYSVSDHPILFAPTPRRAVETAGVE